MTSTGEQPLDLWIEIQVSADHEAVEPVVELFSQFGYQGGVAIEEPFTQDLDGENLAVDQSKPVLVRTYLPADQFTDHIRESLENSLWHLGRMRPVGELAILTHQPQDWENAWKSHFKPVRASKRVVIRPPWHEFDAAPENIIVTLDPGMAFGTGTHPTTRLCLELIEDHLVEGATVLDAGTGTGILSIAALRLGASTANAIDIDPIAVRQAAQNIELNGLQSRATVVQGDLSYSPGQHDFVIANIITRILVEIRDTLIASVAPDGTLLLSGIIEDKEKQVLDAFGGSYLALVERRQMGDWIAHLWR
ncbi:50S ribosomal protein L11 methyltransferase [soil metagenome]